MDWGPTKSTSDPYVVVMLGSDRLQTEVIKATCDPVRVLADWLTTHPLQKIPAIAAHKRTSVFTMDESFHYRSLFKTVLERRSSGNNAHRTHLSGNSCCIPFCCNSSTWCFAGL
eukprot:4610154-Amphidinium_carterae.1